MNNFITILCGATCTGKTSVRDELTKNWGYTPIITVTDRPIRPLEINGKDYDFVSPEAFDRLMEEDFFLETVSYSVAVSDRPWRYGTKLDSFRNIESDKNVLILNPYGIQEVIKKIPRDQYCIIQLTSSIETIKKRLKQRGDNNNEADRRINADIIDFQNISPDIVIPNENNEDISKVARDIVQFVEFWKAGK